MAIDWENLEQKVNGMGSAPAQAATQGGGTGKTPGRLKETGRKIKEALDRRDEYNRRDWRPYLVLLSAIFFILFFYLGCVCSTYIHRSDGLGAQGFIQGLIHFYNIPAGFIGIFRMVPGVMAFYLGMWVLATGLVAIHFVRERKMDPDREKGDAQWNNWKDYNVKFTFPKGEPGFHEPPENERCGESIGNMILSEKTRLNMCTSAGAGTGLSDNVMVIGTTGSGKSFNYVTPNILQMNSSYVVTDPSGEMLTNTGRMLMEHGYRIRILNLSDMGHSCRYNPFKYIRKDEDVLELVDCLIMNTTDKDSSKGDEFFSKAEKQLFLALFYYIHYEVPPEEQNMAKVLELLQLAEVSERNEALKSPLDMLFEKLEKKDKYHTAVINYKGFKTGSGKTMKSILISANVRLAPFTIKAVRNLTSADELELDQLGNGRYALFIITKAESGTFNFIPAMAYTQMFTSLYAKAQENKDSWLWKKGPTVALSEFCGSMEPDKIEESKKRLGEKQAIFLAAELKELNPEDEPGGDRLALYDKDGNVLKKFMGQAEADRFIDAIKNGRPERIDDLALPSHVRILLDEFANTCQVPNFLKILSTIRKYSISCDIILQSYGQIQALYDKDYKTLVDNCSTKIYLGTQNDEDLKAISDSLGNRTIQVSNRKAGGKGSSENVQKDARALMTPDEIRTMPNDMCLVIVQGQNPFRDKKFKSTDHPCFKEAASGDPSRRFDFRDYFLVPEVLMGAAGESQNGPGSRPGKTGPQARLISGRTASPCHGSASNAHGTRPRTRQLARKKAAFTRLSRTAT